MTSTTTPITNSIETTSICEIEKFLPSDTLLRVYAMLDILIDATNHAADINRVYCAAPIVAEWVLAQNPDNPVLRKVANDLICLGQGRRSVALYVGGILDDPFHADPTKIERSGRIGYVLGKLRHQVGVEIGPM